MSVLRRHLETMQRLGIEYDFLPRESEILSLHFWDAARQVMIERGSAVRGDGRQKQRLLGDAAGGHGRGCRWTR